MDRGLLREMTFAGIDIGSNTVLLLVARVTPGGDILTLSEEQRFPRIGRNMDSHGSIRPEAFGTVAGILADYAAIARARGATCISCCATSAVRNAANRSAFLSHLKSATGLDIEVIDGLTEAELTYRGVTAGMPTTDESPVVLDIGGGSTEFSYRTGHGPGPRDSIRRHSLETGSVRLTERFFPSLPPPPDAIPPATDAVERLLGTLPRVEIAGRPLVAVAGTATTLACIDLGLREFSRGPVEGHRIGRGRLSELTRELLGMGPDGVRALSDTTEGRQDILAAGALILSSVAGYFGFSEVRISTRGLRHGIVLRDRARPGGPGER